MGHELTNGGRATRAMLGACALALLCLALAAPAQAAGPFHARAKALDIEGLNHACGVATDSKGDLYAASAGTSEVKVYDPSHALLTSISNTNEPCGLAVTTTGNLYVSEQATGEVVRYKPSAYPFAGTPTYGEREVIDASGNAKGIAVDPTDNRLYVAEGTKVAIYKADGSFEANVGEGTLTEATGVAAYTYTSAIGTDRYLWVADAKGILADRLYLFGGSEPAALKLRRELDGATTPDGSFGFGPAGAYLAADPGNRNSKGECIVVGEQACTAGHLFLYDDAHEALDEFDATGEYLAQTANAAFADAEPTAVAIDRSGTANDGTVYVTAGAGTGAKALAFGPLKTSSRKALKKPTEEAGGLSQELKNARAVATDSHGNVYAAADAFIHVYGSDGKKITEIEDEHNARDLAVDSAGNVYVFDENEGFFTEGEVTYYAPSDYPPDSGTTYSRHEPPIVISEDFPAGKRFLKSIGVNPGPGPGKDHLFVSSFAITREYDSAKNGSTPLDEEFAKCVTNDRQSVEVNGADGTVYFAGNVGGTNSGIFAVDPTGETCLRRFESTGAPSGKKAGLNPVVAVDQASGHVVAFDGVTSTAREYDAAGSFVAAFGTFTEGLNLEYRVAVDNSCALQEPPLTGKACEEFDPANGTAYVAFDDTNPSHPPYDVSAFGPLEYPAPAKHELTVEKTGTGSGTVTSSPAGIACGATCSAEFEETQVVTLTAKADELSESKFEGWTGCEAEEEVSPTEGICEVTMSEAREVGAEFNAEGEEFELEVELVGPGSGEVTSQPGGIECPSECVAEFVKNVNVSLAAAADGESEFVKWSGCDSVNGNGECLVSMTSNKKVTVEFDVLHPLLTVLEEGGGAGTVTSGPPHPGIECPPTCSHKFDLGDEVTLEAAAGPGSKFEGWSDCDAEIEPEPGIVVCEVTMDEPRQVTATFTALPQAIAKQAQPLSYHEATLRGEVDTAGLQTKYHFEYLTQAEYEKGGESFAAAQSTPVTELAPGEGFVSVEASLTGLEEGTEYRFRLLAENSAGLAEDEGSFETLRRRSPQSCPNAEYRTGLSANLPDCRAYELVTPAQTNGLTPNHPNDGGTPSGSFSNWLTVQRGEEAGERLSYFTDGTLPGFEGNGRLDGYRAERGAGEHPAGGWQSFIFSPGYAESAPGLSHFALQHGISSDQLYSIWESNPEPETFPQTLPQGVYLRTPAGFEPIGRGSLGEDLGAPSRYVSPGGAHVIFASDEHLEEEAAPKGTVAIYDRGAGEASAEVISVKPDGSAFGEGEGASYGGATEDGAAVVFSVDGTLYLHREGETTQIAAAPNTFAGISEDGTRVFYAATTNGASPAALYACDVGAGPCAGPGAHPPEEIAAAGIFAAVSADGSRAFFSSTEALSGGEENENGEEAEAGVHNLYVWDGSSTHFFGQLSAEDFEQNAFAGIGDMNLTAWTRSFGLGNGAGRAYAPTRSTPGGDVFVFQSHARLTAYDNEGVGEIYRYDPAAEAGKRLLCVSCDPTGAPPTEDALLEDIRGLNVVPLKPKTMIANLTDSGDKVFFQSFDRLLPEDANEVEDVYEWEAEGVGGCTRPGGCLALISSGQGEEPSFLYAMSADGRDVFVHTKEKLVGADVAGSPSIYDARAGGGIPEPTPPAPCQGDACQGIGTEAPSIPSAATTGSGEAGAASPGRRCAKGKHRVKRRCVSVKKKHRHRKRRHRQAHANRGGNR